MAFLITASNSDGNGQTNGSFPDSYVISSQDPSYDPNTWWSTVGNPIVIGTSAILNSSVRHINVDEHSDQYPFWWQVYQENNFTTSSMAISQDIIITFPEHTFVHTESWWTYFDPLPLASISPIVPMEGFLSSMQFIYQGSDGDDRFDFTSPVFALGGEVHGGAGNDYFISGSGTDHIYGEAGDDDLNGGAGDYLDGGADNDAITGAHGATMIGGSGSDIVILDLSATTAAVNFKLADQASEAFKFDASTSIQGFETFFVQTGSGDDVLDLRDFAAETHVYNPYNSVNSYFNLWSGTDTVFVSSTTKGFYTLYGVDTLNVDLSQSAEDVIITATYVHTSTLDVNIEENPNYPYNSNHISSLIATGGAGNDTISGSDGADVLKGGAGDDILYGLSGNDVMDGGVGSNRLYGGAGNDKFAVTEDGSFNTIMGEDGDDSLAFAYGPGTRSAVFDGGAGNDSAGLDFSLAQSVTATVNGNAVVYDILGADGYHSTVTLTSVERVTVVGSAGNDTFYGTSGKDWIDGGAGADTVHGSAGDDGYVFDNAGDRVVNEVAGGGTDTIWASVSVNLKDNAFVENLRLSGGAINGIGNQLANMITGNSCSNLIAGGAGNDSLYGKGGADTFHFNEMGAPNKDSIWDFDADDKISLGSVFTGLDKDNNGVVDDDAFLVLVKNGPKVSGDHAVITYNAATGVLSYDHDGAGKDAAQDIAFVGVNKAFFDHSDVLINSSLLV